MENIKITKVLTSNGITIAYELSNGRQITLENALELAKKGCLANVDTKTDKNGFEYLVGRSEGPFSLNDVPYENINRPSD